MTTKQHAAVIALMATLFAASCGNEPPATGAANTSSAAPQPSASAVPNAGPSSEKKVVSKEEVELAWKCRGLMSAVWAFKQSQTGTAMPAFTNGVTVSDGSYWTIRAANLTYDGMTDEAESALIGGSVRVIATAQAVENNKADIEACIAAKNAG